MGFKIDDGTGKGTSACVDSGNRVCTFAVSETGNKFSNKEGVAWSAYFTVTPAGANDYFFYFKNTGIKDLAITCISVSSTVATRLEYDVVTGTPVFTGGEETIAPVNRNLGSSKIPVATLTSDTDITGLSDDGTLHFEEIAATATKYTLEIPTNIIVPLNAAVAFKRVAATGAITCLVSFTEIDNLGK